MDIMAVSLAGYAALIIWMVVLIALGFATDYLLARIFGNRTHRVFVAIGVIVHESSHWLACKLTGTQVFEVSMFEATGGHVTHEKRGPVVMAVIGMAPIIGGSLFLMLLGFVFGLAGVTYARPDIDLNDPLATSASMLMAAGTTLWANLSAMSFVTLLFLLFLYLVWSMVACIAPSGPDMKNAALGAVIVVIIGALVVYLHPLSLAGILGTPVLEFIASNLMIVVGVGIIMSIIPMIIAIPVALIKSK
jgi:hypothetical protein